MRRRSRVLAALALVLSALPAAALAREYSVVRVDLRAAPTRIHWGARRAAGASAGVLDLFVHTGKRVRVWWQRPDGFRVEPDEVLGLPADPGLVDFGDVRGDRGDEVVVVTRRGVFADRGVELLAELRDGKGGVFGENPRPRDPGGAFVRLVLKRRLATARSGAIPTPLDPMPARFVRDLDGDGRDDIVLARQFRYEIYRRDGETFVATGALAAEHSIVIATGGPDLIDPLSIEIDIPRLGFVDLNADGRLDVMARSSGGRKFYLQGPQGFPAEPSYELDLDRFKREERASGGRRRRRRGRGDAGGAGVELRGRSVRRSGVQVHEADIDGDGRLDYLVGSGQVLRVYFGEATGVDFARPHLARRLSAELQGVGSFDVNRDGLLDLVAVKFEVPSIPRLIAAYFLSMSVELEVLGYFNRGGRSFSRRPDRKQTLTIELPALREVIEDFSAIAERFLAGIDLRRRYVTGDIDGDGRDDAVFLGDDGVVRVYHARPAERFPTSLELGDLFFHPAKRTWKLDELLKWISGSAYAAARASTEGRAADVEVSLGVEGAADRSVLEVMDLNGDGVVDFVVRCDRPPRVVVGLSRE